MVPRNFCNGLVFHWCFGFRSLNVPGYKKLLHYAMVSRHPFDGYPLLPAAEYIKNDHTGDFIYLLLSQIQTNLVNLG